MLGLRVASVSCAWLSAALTPCASRTTFPGLVGDAVGDHPSDRKVRSSPAGAVAALAPWITSATGSAARTSGRGTRVDSGDRDLDARDTGPGILVCGMRGKTDAAQLAVQVLLHVAQCLVGDLLEPRAAG